MTVSHGLTKPLAISIRQPWAELILLGRKSIEIRSWSSDYRGPVYVHTGLRTDEAALQYLNIHEALFTGGYVGRVEIVDIEPFTAVSWSNLRPCHLSPGPLEKPKFAWRLEHPTRFSDPVPAPGKLGLFGVSEQDAEKLRRL